MTVKVHLHLGVLEFFIGQRDLLDLLDAENELNSARNQYAEARYDAFGARYRVYEGIGHLFEATNVDFALQDGQLRVARIETEGNDKLPIPKDEDMDRELDPMDHCDNSIVETNVDQYGCDVSMDISITSSLLDQNNVQPQLTDDVFEVETNGVLIITQLQLLANDTDDNADVLEIVDIGQPQTGRLAFDLDDNLIYRPVEGFVGEDTFKYTVSDNRGAAVTGTATIQVREREGINLANVQLVNFIYDEAILTEISQTKVQEIIEQIKLTDNLSIEVYTHTDNVGSDAYNDWLSTQRAEALKELLVANGIEQSSITAVGKGENEPIADNATPAGQAINRRGEFIFKFNDPAR